VKRLRATSQEIVLAIAAACVLADSSFEARATEAIHRQYVSPRSTSMGGVRLTTGLYDDNFFGNPARVTANPHGKFTLVDVSAETTWSSIGRFGQLLKAPSDYVNVMGQGAGDNLHARLQTVVPAYYGSEVFGGKWAFAVGILVSTTSDINLRRSYNVENAVITDVGPALTLGRKLLKDDSLSVGATVHGTYRLSSNTGLTLLEVLRGASLSPLSNGGEGTHVDFGLGATLVLPEALQPWRASHGWELHAALAAQNLLGGGYTNLPVRPFRLANLPPSQGRAIGVGVAARKSSLAPGSSVPLQNVVIALEVQDILNAGQGSFFRTLHLGAEAQYKMLLVRVGINQGYLGGGIGFAADIFAFDLGFYGEEGGLNLGSSQIPSLTARIAMQI